MNIQNGSECRVLWAALSQIYGMCSEYEFTENDMKLYRHFAGRGAAECFGRAAAQCRGVRVGVNVSSSDHVESSC